MSNRTLIEINHDCGDSIEKNPEDFVKHLLSYLSGGCERSEEELHYYGIRVIGMKHHSEGHDITWGGVQEQEDR